MFATLNTLVFRKICIMGRTDQNIICFDHVVGGEMKTVSMTAKMRSQMQLNLSELAP